MLRILSSLLFCCYIFTVQPTYSKISKAPKPKKKESFIQFDDELEYTKYCCQWCFCPPEIIISGTDVKTNKRFGFVLAERLGAYTENPFVDGIFGLPMNRICATISSNLLNADHPLATPPQNQSALIWT